MIKFQRLGVVLAPKDNKHAKFNAGMIKTEDKVRMFYRWSEHDKLVAENAFDYLQDFVSYAELTLDGKIVKDLDKEVIGPSCEFDKYGCQDPRVVKFEGSYYIFFSCWDRAVSRVGVAKTDDFINYQRLGIIPTDFWDKDAYIFPERINGKIAYVHRVEPDIQFDYFDNIEDMFEVEYWNNYNDKLHDKVVMRSEYEWENKKIGGSVPPIKTELGWLFIYHGVNAKHEYRAGAALLDLADPSKVLARLPYPIIEPETEYEKVGDVANVVFPQGAYIHDGELYVSYGGADKVVAIAKANYNDLLMEFKKRI